MYALAPKLPALRRRLFCLFLASSALQLGAPAVEAMPKVPKKMTAEDKAKYARTMNMIRGGVFGAIVVMVGFGALYVAAHTGMAGNFGPRFFSAPGETIMVRFIMYLFISVGVFAALGSMGFKFEFVNFLVGVAQQAPDDGFEQQLGLSP